MTPVTAGGVLYDVQADNSAGLLISKFDSTMSESALELFRDACGLRAPLALECQDSSGTTLGAYTHQFDCPFALIGRDPRSDVVLHGAEVSRNHAFFQVVSGQVFCIDLNSRNQLLWEGETEKRARGWLDPGLSVRIGPYAIRRVGADLSLNRPWSCPDPMVVAASEDPRAPSLPHAALDLPIRIGEGQPWWMDSRLALVGRSESCQIMLRDPSVSRFHAALVRTSKGVWVVDLNAREGVVINGMRLKWAWLDDGDTLRIGQFTFILRYQTVPEQISRRDVPLEAGARPSDSNTAVHHGQASTTLAVRSSGTPATPASVLKSSPALMPDVLVPERAAEWDRGLPLPHEQQFAMWQQQMRMMESFHQDMILMVQMFMAMHREHRVAIREELDRVQKLTRKLSVLQRQLTLTEGSAGEDRSANTKPPEPEVGKSRRSSRNGKQLEQGLKPPSNEPSRSRISRPAPRGEPL